MGMTADELRGMYAFVPIPWDEDFELDRETLEADVRYLAQTELSGIYTPDTSGEFFTLDLPEFRTVVDVLADVAGPEDIDVQIGCHWTNARGACERASYAARDGVDAIRFSFPYWSRVTPTEGIQFAKRLADAADGTPLVHYNNPNVKIEFGVDEYRTMVEEVPSLIGTKQLIRNPYDLSRLLDRIPDVSHFIDESVFTQGMAAGASGMYAWIAAINPRLAMEWYEACVESDWGRAMEIQTMANRYRHVTTDRWGIDFPASIHKLNARLNPNLSCPLRVRPPYRSGTAADLEWAERWVRREMPELLER